MYLARTQYDLNICVCAHIVKKLKTIRRTRNFGDLAISRPHKDLFAVHNEIFVLTKNLLNPSISGKTKINLSVNHNFT